MKTKEVDYFELFVEAAKVCLKAAVVLDELLQDPKLIPEKVKVIHDIEHEGDCLYHTLVNHLNRSFITPIERQDILEISQNIEETIDTIDEVAIMFNIMSVTTIRPETHQMVELIKKSCNAMVAATEELKNFKKSKELTPLIIELNNIEEAGDKLYQDSIKNLFEKEKDTLEVVKWQKILNTLEDVLDACENVADSMEGVVLKNT